MDTTSEAVGATLAHTEHIQKKLNTRETKTGGKHDHPYGIYSAFVCLMRHLPLIICIITALNTASAGLSGIQRYTMYSTERARFEAHATSYTLLVEQQIHSQLDQLTATRLGRNVIETYDECLARGLRHANSHFYSVGFQYSHIRNQTIVWVTENCGRLHHAPQTVQPSLQVKVLNHIARASYRARRITEMVTEFATLKAKALWARITAHWLILADRQQPLISTTPKRTLQKLSPPKSTWMPFGFRLLCKDGSSCQLVFAPRFDRSMPADNVPLSNEDVHKTLAKYQSLVRLHRGVGLMKSSVDWLALLLAPLQLAGVVLWIIMDLSTMQATRPLLGQKPNMAKTALDLLRRYNTEQSLEVMGMATQIVTMIYRAKPATTSARVNSAELLFGLFLLMASQTILLLCGHQLRSAGVDLGRTATLSSNGLRLIALGHFNEVRRVASHLGRIVSAYYNEPCPTVLRHFHEMRRIASHPGELVNILSMYGTEFRRIAAKSCNALGRSASQFSGEIHGFFVHWLNFEARIEEYRRKNTTLQSDGNVSETESESGGIATTSNEVRPVLDRNSTHYAVNGENDTDSETESDLDSATEDNSTPVTVEDDSDSDFETGSESDGSLTPASDEDENWAIVDLADA